MAVPMADIWQEEEVEEVLEEAMEEAMEEMEAAEDTVAEDTVVEDTTTEDTTTTTATVAANTTAASEVRLLPILLPLISSPTSPILFLHQKTFASPSRVAATASWTGYTLRSTLALQASTSSYAAVTFSPFAT